MLSELRVRNLGVIEDLTIRPGPGLTALTGETGAGKTLVIEALGLVFGARSDATLVRAGAAEALVEARFELAEGSGSSAAAGELVVAREVPVRGRTRGWANGRMATLAELADQGRQLVDIHGQHDQHSLGGAAGSRRALDAYAGADPREVQRLRRQLRAIDDELTALGGGEQERAREADILRYQLEEIDRAGIADVGEDERLRVDEDRLADSAAYLEAASDALGQLTGGGEDDGGGALDALARAVGHLSGREAFAGWEGRLRGASSEIDDVARDLRNVLTTWEQDPAALSGVQERRRVLADLRRKYGDTLSEVVEFSKRARSRLDELERAGDQAQQLGVRRAGTVEALGDAEAALGEVRRDGAGRISVEVTDRLRRLAMPHASIGFTVEGEAGDRVVIELAANPGEPPLPLGKVASGGELARTTLALRLVASGGPDTMVFDEVDAGVGGEAARALGEALAELAARRQVLVVTHLPQVAAFADHQLVVRKSTRDGRTVTEVSNLEGEDRVVELARMLSGSPGSATAQAHARELLVRSPARTERST